MIERAEIAEPPIIVKVVRPGSANVEESDEEIGQSQVEEEVVEALVHYAMSSDNPHDQSVADQCA